MASGGPSLAEVGEILRRTHESVQRIEDSIAEVRTKRHDARMDFMQRCKEELDALSKQLDSARKILATYEARRGTSKFDRAQIARIKEALEREALAFRKALSNVRNLRFSYDDDSALAEMESPQFTSQKSSNLNAPRGGQHAKGKSFDLMQIEQDFKPLSRVDLLEQEIERREKGVHEIATGIQQVKEMFQDVHDLVEEQGESIQKISTNVESVHAETHAGVAEVERAETLQKSSLCVIQ